MPTGHNQTGRWPEQMVARLKVLYNDEAELSHGVIAQKMSREFPEYPGSLTRNAIIGQVARERERGHEGFAKRGRTCRAVREPRMRHEHVKSFTHMAGRPPKVKGNRYHAISGAPIPAPEEMIVGQTFDEAFIPKAKATPKNLFDLKTGECKWPVDVEGETLQMFCAAECVGTYCNDHGGRRGGRQR